MASLASIPYERPADYRAQIDAALERAAGAGKRVAVVFGADWCPDCRALDTALEDPYVEPIVSRAFEVVKVGVGRKDRNLDLAESLGVPVRNGIPAISILAPDGSVVAAQADGEFRGARALSRAEIATFFRRWAPEGTLEAEP
jgi:protein disulfide-isomerase